MSIFNIYSGCSNLTSITIPNSVTSIEKGVFYCCSSLSSIAIPNSVTSIGETSFAKCSNLVSVTIPNNVTSIGKYAFDGCSCLSFVTIGNSVTSIHTDAFRDCRLISVTFHCKQIGSWFSGIQTIKEIIIGNEVISIGNKAFSNCSGINSMTIPSNILYLASNAFDGCDNLRKMIWLSNTPPSGYSNTKALVNYVSNDQYKGLNNIIVYPFLNSLFEVNGVKYVPVSPSERSCDAIDCVYNLSSANIKISSTVTYQGINMDIKKIQPYICYNNTFIESLTLDVEGDVPNNAFNYCYSLKNVMMGDKVLTIGDNAFQGCISMESIVIPNSVKTLSNNSFSECTSLSNITIGNQVEQIESSSFYHCSSLEKISIPNSVTSIGRNVFNGCTKLKEVIIKDRNYELKLASNYSSPLFSSCPLDTVYIGGNITFDISPFRNTTLRSVVITDKETEITDQMFMGCSKLQNITIGDGVTKFGDWAFSGCSNLKSLYFGSKLKTIGKEAFSDCTSVTQIVSKAAIPPQCDLQALDDINKWTCTLHVPQGSKEAYQSSDQWKEFFYIEEDNTSGISQNSTKAILIHNNEGKLIFQGIDDGTKVCVYNTAGVLIDATICDNGSVTLNTNLKYGNTAIVKIGNTSFKVLVR